jgi:predicted dehydrogenase
MRVGLVGCGAVARIYYVPALRQLECDSVLKLAWAFDPETEAARALVNEFDGAATVATFDELLDERPDFIVIASPPQYHAEQAIAAFDKGIPVHCEKPLATSLEEGRRMVAEARRAGVPLSIGMVRRRLAPVRMIRELLQGKAIGPLQSIHIFEGGPFHWPVRSPAYFDRNKGAVGVLDDVGTHVLDLLNWWLGEPDDVAYADDAMGGVAANCRVSLRYGDSIAIVRLSRDWYRPNEWVLRGETGTIRWSVDDWERVELRTSASGLSAKILAGDDDGKGGVLPAITFEQAFAVQLADFARSLNGVQGSFVPGAEALPVLETLGRCAAARTQMDMPWLK